MRKLLQIIILATILGYSPPAGGEMCTIDQVPAATVLLPYFEVDYGDSTGVNTLFYVGNAQPGPVLVNVTFWTDLAVPTIRFNLYLTGYDIEAIDLKGLFAGGEFPQTSSTLSNVGNFSGANSSFSGCNLDGLLPRSQLTTAELHGLQQAHSGASSLLFGGQCAGRNLGDGLARGYITIDNVSGCSELFPAEHGYFNNNVAGIALFDNVLWGEYTMVDPINKRAFSEALVPIEAAPNSTTFSSGDYSFYGRYLEAEAGDRREPLATSHFVRYLSSGSTEDQRTRLFYWRDTGTSHSPFDCGVLPQPYPLGQTQIVYFDEQENAEALTGLNPFPAACGSVTVGGPDFPVSFNFGWAYLNLNTTVSGAEFGTVKQSTITAEHRSPGLSVGASAYQTDSACGTI
jgi:hypothetical protein